MKTPYEHMVEEDKVSLEKKARVDENRNLITYFIILKIIFSNR